MWKLSKVQLYVYEWPSTHCLYFIYARKIFVRMTEKVRDSGIHLKAAIRSVKLRAKGRNNIQQCWELLDNNVAPVCTRLNLFLS